ncbi:MAG: hypothetical protein FWG28_05660 [Clostridiales bacterium]|nr:hypothetical protein [Clostridiales bacterium]
MYKIALLTYPYLAPYFEETVMPMRAQCDIELVTFEKQSQLLTMIPDLAEQYDGLCVFSALVEKFINQSHPSLPKPILYLDRHCVDYFKTFFMMLSDKRDIDFSRVLIDTSLIHPENTHSLEYAMQTLAQFEERRILFTEDISMEDFIDIEAKLEGVAMDLWQRGKFDVLVCRFANMASLMERQGIPYVFVYPERHRIEDTLVNLLNRIRLDKQTEGLPASIMIAPGGDNRREFQEISADSIRIQRALLEFSKNYSSNFTIQFMSQGYEILTSQMTVQKITGDFTTCQLGYFLFSTLGVNARIGYGIGNDISNARQHAIRARKAAEDSGVNCVINGDGTMIPLQLRSSVRQSPGQGDGTALLVDRTGLSPVTIQRIRSALQFLGTNDVTNHNLAEALQVTVANANRFLNALVNSGNAAIVDTKKGLSKGRPSRIYRINL